MIRAAEAEKRAKKITPKRMERPSIHWNSFVENKLKKRVNIDATINTFKVVSESASKNDSKKVTIFGISISFFP